MLMAAAYHSPLGTLAIETEEGMLTGLRFAEADAMCRTPGGREEPSSPVSPAAESRK